MACWTILACFLAVPLGGSASGEEGASIQPLKAKKLVKAGHRVRFFLRVNHAPSCSAHLAGIGRRLPHAARFDVVEVFADIPSKAKPGVYPLVVSCADGGAPVQLRLVVIKADRNAGSTTAIGRDLAIIGFHVRRLSFEEARTRAHERWLKEKPVLLALYATGQCTDWAAQKRPDIVQSFYEETFASELLNRPRPEPLGEAKHWSVAAAALGFTVSDRPVAGALVVWDAGVEGAAAATGHLGYVESVSADGSIFSVSSMNVGGPYRMGYGTLSAVPVQGRSFILP